MIDTDLDTDADGINTVFLPDERRSPRSLLNALNEASSAARNAWLAFLALMTYLMVALAGVSHVDLLLNSPVTLPLLGIDVELDRFFLFAPLVLLFVHGGLVIQHVMLARKVSALEEHMRADEEAEFHPLRYELHSYFFTQVIAGPPRSPVFSAVLAGMMWFTLTAMPVLLLLYFQISFLPFHDEAITWAHRIYILLDIAMLLLIGLFIHAPDTSFVRALWQTLIHRPLRAAVGLIGAVAAVVFSLFIATIPDKTMERIVLALTPAALHSDLGAAVDGQGRRKALFATAMLFEGKTPSSHSWLSGFFQRNLQVTDEDLVPNAEDPFGEVSRHLRNRDLRYARLDRSDLHRADFTGSDLSGASLISANLSSARFNCLQNAEDATDLSAVGPCTKLLGARLKDADLSHADLTATRLQAADLREVNLRNAKLFRAQMQGASLGLADLRGADLALADFRGADLSWANLDGVSAGSARFQGARLKGARLLAANLDHANLQGADLSDALLSGSQMRNARLIGTDLTRAILKAVDLRNAMIWKAAPPMREDTDLANFSGLRIAPPEPAEISEILASLDDITNKELRARIRKIITSLSDVTWADTDAHEKWVELRNAAPIKGDSNKAKRLSEQLALLACDDQSDRGFVANGILARAINDYEGTASLLYRQLTAEPCAAASVLNKRMLRKLAALALKTARRAQRPSSTSPHEETAFETDNNSENKDITATGTAQERIKEPGTSDTGTAAATASGN